MSIKSDFEEKTVAELREMCKSRQIAGMTKKRKDIIVDALVKNERTARRKVSSVKKAKAKDPESMEGVSFEMNSTITKPSARLGDRTTSTIKVSCGASSGEYPVCGKSVGAIKNFLREVLNVDQLAEGLVNGDQVEDNYVLKDGDDLEFLKPAGRKG